MVLLRYALLKTNYKSAQDRVGDGGICKFISKGDVDSLGKKNKENAIAAHSILQQCRSLIERVKDDPHLSRR